MGTRLARLASGKFYTWFWFIFTVVSAVVDIATGSLFFAVLMILLSVFWGYQLRTIYNGTNSAYNRYHGEKVL